MVNRKEERNTVEVSTMVRPVNFLERNAYRQLNMTRSGYPMKLVFFSICYKRSWISGYHSSRMIRAHVSKCAFVGGIIVLPASVPD